MFSSDRAERIMMASSILRNMRVKPDMQGTIDNLAARITSALWNEPHNPSGALKEIVLVKRIVRLLRDDRDCWMMREALNGVLVLMSS